MIQVDHESLRAQVRDILRAWGMEAEAAEATCGVMVETDLRGIDSHGVSMLPMYDQMRREGKLNLAARPRMVAETAVLATMDADAGLGHAVSLEAMGRAVDKALQHGCGVVTVRNSHHFGAAGIYAETAARRGVIGMVATSTRFVTMVPTFAAQPVLGTNPIAFAAPTGDPDRPVVLDMATTTSAAGRVKVRWLNNQPVPAGWVVDGTGRPVTDPDEAMRTVFDAPEGGLTPLGGTHENGSHKGYGLALMVHILGGVLTGASFAPIRNRSRQPHEPDNIGHFFMAIDPKALRPAGEFESDLDVVTGVLRSTRPADPARSVMVAGDPEREIKARRLVDGIPIPGKLAEQLRAIAEAGGTRFLLDSQP